jgi:diguanylate cyclase (GGDEF)-like protein
VKKPDIPQDELARLEMLRSLDILDTLPEERFDRLTRMAKRMFGVPIAVVSLVDENRVWLKSWLDLVEASETSRDVSFCGHAILGNEAFIIPNTLEDRRFADNPFVLSDPGIRFYAGCPLAVNGYKLGMLCIVDLTPRNFCTEDIEALKDLASMVESELAAVQLATMDELTNISNRRGFMVLAQHSLNFCVRQKIPAALIFLDLDKFKPINDKFGHAEGDAALIAFAKQMKSTFRDSDLFGRLGGDEFVVLLGGTSKQQAEDVIEKFRHSLKKYNQEENRGYDVSFSYGIVEFNPEKNCAIEELLAVGDSLMYEVKNAKR